MKPAEKVVKINAAEKAFSIRRVAANHQNSSEIDTLAVEEPLEIRLGLNENGKQFHRAVSITMRTPGNDFELAAGFLFTEGILKNKNQITGIKHCGKFPSAANTVRVDLAPDVKINFKNLARSFYTTSSCGVCGKASLEALAIDRTALETVDLPQVTATIVHSLPDKLRAAQNVFATTGGLHAAALFDATSGKLLALREDVGRHNAVDKLIGAKFLAGEIPLANEILFLSGRASFELVQKALAARISIIVAVGAPSSLAVEAAAEFGITLLGFVRENRFNIYTGSERIIFQTGNL